MERPRCGTCDQRAEDEEEPDRECMAHPGHIRRPYDVGCVHHQDFAAWRELKDKEPIETRDVAKGIVEAYASALGNPPLTDEQKRLGLQNEVVPVYRTLLTANRMIRWLAELAASARWRGQATVGQVDAMIDEAEEAVTEGPHD